MIDDWCQGVSLSQALGRVLVLASVLSTGVALAQDIQGQDPPTPNFGIAPAANTQRALADPPGVSARVIRGFHASLGVGLGYTDNAGRTPPGTETSDNFLALTPALGYKTNLGRHVLQITYAGFAERYQDLTNLDFANHRILAAMSFDITRKLQAGAYAGWAEVNEQRGTPGTPLLTVDPNKIEIISYGASASFGSRDARRMQVRGGVGREEWRFQNNNQQLRDRDYDRAFASVHYNPTDRTTVFLLGTYQDIDYTQESPGNLDSEETAIQVGAEWQATARTHGVITIGNLEKKYDNPSVDDFSGLTYTARIRWQPRSYSGVSVYASRRPEEADTVADNFFVSTMFGVSVDHGFTDRITGYAYLNFLNDDYNVTDREDDYTDFAIGADYIFRRWLSFGARYGRIERDSNVALAEYTENYFALTLRATYQHDAGSGSTVTRAE